MFFYVGAKKMRIALIMMMMTMMMMMLMMMIVITVFMQSSYMCSSNAMDPDTNVNNLSRSLSSFEEIATACMGQYKFRYDSDLQRSFFTHSLTPCVCNQDIQHRKEILRKRRDVDL